MKSNSKKLMGAALALGLATSGAQAFSVPSEIGSSAFIAVNEISSPMDIIAHGAEHKCGEGKCGEGKCGAAKSAKPATPATPAAKTVGEHKCGEGKCGGHPHGKKLGKGKGKGKGKKAKAAAAAAPKAE